MHIALYYDTSKSVCKSAFQYYPRVAFLVKTATDIDNIYCRTVKIYSYKFLLGVKFVLNRLLIYAERRSHEGYMPPFPCPLPTFFFTKGG